MQYTVTITKKHCEGREYRSCTNCPLCAAIREQLPDFKLKYVGGDCLTDVDNNTYLFNCDALSGFGWTSGTIQELLSEKIDKYVLDFWEEGTKPISGTAEPKEKIRYVSVPCSITEQTKELILQ